MLLFYEKMTEYTVVIIASSAKSKSKVVVEKV